MKLCKNKNIIKIVLIFMIIIQMEQYLRPKNRFDLRVESK